MLPGVQIDTEINARYLYDFMIAFTPGSSEVKKIGPACIHNLSDDGKLWMAYPQGDVAQVFSLTSTVTADGILYEETGFRRVSTGGS
ncbi:MAG: hypothetical protein MZV63_53795 [Marinilabiliales bacterium]|nr:hypothetical protein [Marinilabiliales bacterium]